MMGLPLSVQLFERRWWPGPLVLASAVFLAAAPARAEVARPADIVVRYAGPADCSSAAEFIERAAPRLPALRLVEGRGDVGLEVILRPEAEGVAAELVIHLEDGGSLSRAILASTCDEAVEAIAFVASVALDPGATRPVVVQSAGPDAEMPAEHDEALEAVEALEREEAKRRRRRRERRTETGTVGLLGVGAALGFGVAPSALLGPELSLAWSRAQPGAWSPAVVMQAQYLLVEGVTPPAGVASFHQGRASLGFCPSAFALGVLSGRACLGLAGGWVESEGSRTDLPAQATRPFFDTNLSARLQLALGKQSAVILSGYAALPWIRDSYRFDDTVFYRTSPLTGGLSLSIGARLW